MPNEAGHSTVDRAGGERRGASDDDLRVVAALRAGDEAAFASLVDQHGGALQRLALNYVRDRSVAQEVVQETWLGLLQSLERFEGRSSLKTWIFHILVNCARSRARKESRSVPFSSLGETFADSGEPAVDPSRFQQHGARWAGHWASPPGAWHQSPESSAISNETRACVRDAIAGLKDTQRTVITLRDVEGFSSEEVCNLLQISDTNQRVLLHRARASVRRALEAYFEESN
jgi:RNA polymerase sigma-70 factor (ECF subfamily)